MTKIVINVCYGGFGLSEKAIDALSKRKGVPLDELSLYTIDRADPDLVAVVEALGDTANGFCAYLRVRELPSGTRYRIREYDGSEHIETEADIKWLVA